MGTAGKVVSLDLSIFLEPQSQLAVRTPKVDMRPSPGCRHCFRETPPIPPGWYSHHRRAVKRVCHLVLMIYVLLAIKALRILQNFNSVCSTRALWAPQPNRPVLPGSAPSPTLSNPPCQLPRCPNGIPFSGLAGNTAPVPVLPQVFTDSPPSLPYNVTMPPQTHAYPLRIVRTCPRLPDATQLTS